MEFSLIRNSMRRHATGLVSMKVPDNKNFPGCVLVSIDRRALEEAGIDKTAYITLAGVPDGKVVITGNSSGVGWRLRPTKAEGGWSRAYTYVQAPPDVLAYLDKAAFTCVNNNKQKHTITCKVER